MRDITGYRDLTADDVNLMNCIKAKEAEIAGLPRVVRGNLARPRAQAPDAQPAKAGPDADEAVRQIAMARTEFEHAFMRLVRAVARPASPWVG